MMINNRGQIIGTSNLAGDQSTHAFVWEKGVMTDLGTFGGVNSFPVWINDVGEIVGEADLQGSAVTHLHHAFLWKKGVMTDLGTLGSTSHAEAVNSRGQVVGRSRLGDPSSILQHAFLWENGGTMVDLNTTIPANSGLQLIDAVNINDGGEILVIGLPLGVEPVGDVELGRLVLLVPCSGVESGCGIDDLATAASATAAVNWTTSSTQRHSTTSGTPASWRARLAQRLHVVGFTGSRDYLTQTSDIRGQPGQTNNNVDSLRRATGNLRRACGRVAGAWPTSHNATFMTNPFGNRSPRSTAQSLMNSGGDHSCSTAKLSVWMKRANCSSTSCYLTGASLDSVRSISCRVIVGISATFCRENSPKQKPPLTSSL